MNSFSIVFKTGFDPVLNYVAFRCRQEGDCSCIDLKDPFVLFCWCTAEVVGLADRHWHEYKQEGDGQFVHHELCRLPIEVVFQSDVHLSSLDDAVVATLEATSDERPESSLGSVVFSVPMPTGDEEGDWIFEYMLPGPCSGDKQPQAVLPSIQVLVSHAWCHPR